MSVPIHKATKTLILDEDDRMSRRRRTFKNIVRGYPQAPTLSGRHLATPGGYHP